MQAARRFALALIARLRVEYKIFGTSARAGPLLNKLEDIARGAKRRIRGAKVHLHRAKAYTAGRRMKAVIVSHEVKPDSPRGPPLHRRG